MKPCEKVSYLCRRNSFIQETMSTERNLRPVTTLRLAEMKSRGEKIAMLTAYDYSMARILDRAGIDVILVGDSAANVMAGYETTVPMTLDVETYTVDFYKEEYSLFEKFYPVKVKTTVNTKQVFFPAGTFVVPMNQKNGNVAASVLEPEAANGFINYRIYETKQGEELPVYRKMNSDK